MFGFWMIKTATMLVSNTPFDRKLRRKAAHLRQVGMRMLGAARLQRAVEADCAAAAVMAGRAVLLDAAVQCQVDEFRRRWDAAKSSSLAGQPASHGFDGLDVAQRRLRRIVRRHFYAA